MTLALPSRRPTPAWVRNDLWRRARAVPSLDLRFAENKSLVDAVTGRNLIAFTRSSSGTFVGSNGLLQTAGTNEPRFDHNPTTGESLGLLVEEQRSNLLLNSETLSTQSVTVAATAHTLSFTGTGTVMLSGTSTAGPLVGTGTGEANRVSLIFTPTAGTLTLTVSGTVSNAQLEPGAFRTSYIPTTGSAATRNADVVSITGTNFSSWYRQDEGTVFTNAINPAISTTAFTISDGSINNRISLDSGTNSRIARVVNSGALQASNGLSYAYGTSQGFAISYAADSITFANAGILGVEDTSAAIPVVDQIRIGANPSGGSVLNSCIRRLTYWPSRSSSSTLQALTQ